MRYFGYITFICVIATSSAFVLPNFLKSVGGIIDQSKLAETPLWYPEICFADTKIVKDRLYFALHGWKKLKDADAIACQVATVLETNNRHGIATEYNKCVDNLAMEKFMDNVLDNTSGGKANIEWKVVKNAVERDAEFRKGVAMCSRKLQHCADVHFLRDCMIRHKNPFVA